MLRFIGGLIEVGCLVLFLHEGFFEILFFSFRFAERGGGRAGFGEFGLDGGGVVGFLAHGAGVVVLGGVLGGDGGGLFGFGGEEGFRGRAEEGLGFGDLADRVEGAAEVEEVFARGGGVGFSGGRLWVARAFLL